MDRSRLLVFTAALVTFAFAAPSAAAASPNVILLNNLNDEGYAYVGDPIEFGYAMLTATEVPGVHQNGLISVKQNGVELFATDSTSSHDYNGINTFRIAFPTTGPFEVHMEVPGLKGVNVKGYAYPKPEGAPPSVLITGGNDVVAGIPTKFDVQVREPGTDISQGTMTKLISGADALLEIRRPADNWLVFRTHLHQSDKAMSFQYAFANSGAYLMRVVAFVAQPSPEGPHFVPTTVTKTVNVGSSAGAVTAMGAAPTLPAAKGNAPYKIVFGTDPGPTNTPFSRFGLDSIVYDPTTQAAVGHVSFAGLLTDAAGRPVFYSDSLHEYDGHYDIVANLANPGPYTFAVAATKGDWVGRGSVPITVATSSSPGGTAQVADIVTAKGLDQLKSGLPTKLTFQYSGPSGQPAQHAELDFQFVRQGWDAPILQNKLHSHGPGQSVMNVTLPEPGDYLLILDPETIHGDPTPNYYYGATGGKLVVPIKVPFGAALPAMADDAANDAPGKSPAAFSPDLGIVFAIVGLGLALVLRRREA